ncbi:type II toxin-antitoxin system VapC family toxin [Okeania sp. SIO2B3]|uniref:type II toxin-antitoxin system VapC family toxin n=1 Tax=Okeania sp. SIO2B3 TaxID=2607784 RepID=UPI0013C11F82|nr:type II toxin-antitoxin system VapC family toxin [Okeania sp. SIO2B3]NET44003.1 type II toxin-antitoxin system VapC family toxin [Okeania sp. SIO2B3]
MSNNSLIYLLDPNVCIVYLKNKNSSVNNYFHRLESDKIAVFSVVKAELFYGSRRSNNPQKSLNIQLLFLRQFVSLPFDDSCFFGIFARKSVGKEPELLSGLAFNVLPESLR